MSVAIMFATAGVYLSHGYRLVLDDLRDFDAVAAAGRFPATQLVSLVAPDDVLRKRLAARRGGFRDAEASISRNALIRARPCIAGELRFDTSSTSTADIVARVERALHAAE